MSETAYVFEGTGHDSELQRLRLLESVFDPGSRDILVRGGLRAGMNCLEIGAGAGSGDVPTAVELRVSAAAG
jgi:hypothetical protein